MKNKLLIISIAICGIALINLPTIKAQCTAGFTVNSSTDPTVTFTNTSLSTGVLPRYNWNFGNGDYSNMQNPTVTYAYADTYNVCLTYSDSLPPCNSSICHTVVITNAPSPCAAHFSYGTDSVLANMVAFYDQSIYHPVKWFWNFGDGATDTLKNPSHQYAATGIYYVCLTVINNHGDTCMYCDSINSLSCAQRLHVSYTYSINNGGAVVFTGNCAGALQPSYSWNFGDGGSSNIQNPSHTYHYNGTYQSCIMYTDSGACSKSFCDAITITNTSSSPCNAIFSYTDSLHTIYFFDNSTSGIVGWFWDFGDGDSVNYQNPIHTYSAGGTYNVCLTVTNLSGLSCSYCNTINVGTNCNNTAASFTMTPDPTPHVWHIVNTTTGTAPISYLWSWGDGTTSTGINPTHTYSMAAWYNICLTVTDAGGCGSSYCIHDSLRASETAISVYVTSPSITGIDTYSDDNKFSIYPNPNNGVFTVIANEINQYQIEIYNVLGEMVYQSIINNAKSEIDLSKESKGIYFVHLKQNNNIVTVSKLIITN